MRRIALLIIFVCQANVLTSFVFSTKQPIIISASIGRNYPLVYYMAKTRCEMGGLYIFVMALPIVVQIYDRND